MYRGTPADAGTHNVYTATSVLMDKVCLQTPAGNQHTVITLICMTDDYFKRNVNEDACTLADVWQLTGPVGSTGET